MIREDKGSAPVTLGRFRVTVKDGSEAALRGGPRHDGATVADDSETAVGAGGRARAIARSRSNHSASRKLL